MFPIEAHCHQHTEMSIRTCANLAQILAPNRNTEHHNMEVSRKRKRQVAGVESTLSGRREEMDSIRSFLARHVKKQRPGSLFVTGPPGTGKTATINEIFKSDTVRKYTATTLASDCTNQC